MNVREMIEFADVPGLGASGKCFVREGVRVRLLRRCRSRRDRNVIVVETYTADVAWVERAADGLYFGYRDIRDARGKLVSHWGCAVLKDTAPEFGIVSVTPAG